MINVILRARLGNNLFQYAVGKHLAIKNNTNVRLNISSYVNRYDILGRKIKKQLNFFEFNPILYSTKTYEKISNRLGIHWPPYSDRVYYEKYRGFHPEVLTLKDGIHLNGFFQSEKYFKDIEQIIRNDFRFKKDSLGKEGAIYKEQIVKSNSVGLHIRRKDYLISKVHNVCNVSYYTKAIAYMQDKLKCLHFFVFSDDIEWCSNNLHISDCSFVNIRSSKMNSVVDLHLMSLCKHNIISNSTFSWWGAWLNENHKKIVVAPNRWYNDNINNSKALQDMIPDDWIRIDF